MKKLWKQILLVLASLFLVVGLVFCVLRPAYVREAVQLLLKNELVIESDSNTLPEEDSENSSKVTEE